MEDLADSIDDDTMERMAIACGQKGTPAWRLRELYGIERPDGPDSLREALHEAFAKGSDQVASHVADRGFNTNVQRILDLLEVDGVALKAIMVWSGGSGEHVDLELDDEVTLATLYDGAPGQIGMTLLIGRDLLWEFGDENPDDGGMMEITSNPLPHAMLPALTGRPLDSIVDNWLIKGSGLYITEARRKPDEDAMHFHLEKRDNPEGRP